MAAACFAALLSTAILLSPRDIARTSAAVAHLRASGTCRLGQPIALAGSGAETRLQQLQTMIEAGASEESILSLLADESVGMEECQAMLAKIQQLRERGQMVELDDDIHDDVRDSVDLEDIDSSKGRTGQPRVIDVTQPMPSPAAAAPAPASTSPAQRSPTAGEHAWGRWRQSQTDVMLELYLSEEVRARELAVEVVEGWLIVRVDTSTEALYEDGVWGGEQVIDDNNGGQPPLLFGRFAQPVVGTDVAWVVDEEAGTGRRVLCIELPKAARDGAAATADCIFDETLLIKGEPFLAPGLSQGFITMAVPRSA
jgi:hypothetical protein